MEIRAANPASMHAQKDFVRLDFGQRDIAVFKLTRGVVNNGFHTRDEWRSEERLG
jgi:hypothetical protein